MNGKIGPVDLTKNENGRVCLKKQYRNQMDPSLFYACSYDIIFKLVLEL